MSLNRQLSIGNRLRAQALAYAQQIQDIDDGIKGDLDGVKGVGDATKEILYLNGIKSAADLYEVTEERLKAIGVNKLSITFIKKWQLQTKTEQLTKAAIENEEAAINS